MKHALTQIHYRFALIYETLYMSNKFSLIFEITLYINGQDHQHHMILHDHEVFPMFNDSVIVVKMMVHFSLSKEIEEFITDLIDVRLLM